MHYMWPTKPSDLYKREKNKHTKANKLLNKFTIERASSPDLRFFLSIGRVGL